MFFSRSHDTITRGSEDLVRFADFACLHVFCPKEQNERYNRADAPLLLQTRVPNIDLEHAYNGDKPGQHFSITKSEFLEFLESHYIDFECVSNGDAHEDTQRSPRCSRGYDGCGIWRIEEASFVVKGSLLSRRLLQGHHDTSDSDESHDFDDFQGKNKNHEGTPLETEEQFFFRVRFCASRVGLNCVIRTLLIVDSSSDRMFRTWKSQWQAQNKPIRVNERTQTTAHQSKRKELAYEFEEYIFMLAVEENGKISDEGKNKDREVNFYMTVYIKTDQRKVNQHQMRQKTKYCENHG